MGGNYRRDVQDVPCVFAALMILVPSAFILWVSSYCTFAFALLWCLLIKRQIILVQRAPALIFSYLVSGCGCAEVQSGWGAACLRPIYYPTLPHTRGAKHGQKKGPRTGAAASSLSLSQPHWLRPANQPAYQSYLGAPGAR